MNQKTLVSEICDEAESFLAGVTKLTEARAGLAEWLTIHHPKLAPDEVEDIVAQAIDVLKQEGFFDVEAGSDA